MTAPLLGAIFLPALAPERLVPIARAADRAGLDQLWLWEDFLRQGAIASAGQVLASTERLTVGLGVLPVPLRNVALTAMELATLERLHPGRLVAGVGHGVQSWMERLGARVESPLTLLREYTTALRALLDGEDVDVRGRYVRLDDVHLDWPPDSALPLMIGTGGPRSLRLSGELADGTILVGGTTPERVTEVRELVDAAARAAGRPGHHHLAVQLMTATGPRAEQRMAAEIDLWADIEPGPGRAVAGDAATVAAAVDRLVAAGADSVILQPTQDEETDMEDFMVFVARDVRPLLSVSVAGPG
jgi:alkanesulfonate monooxygenase SsuD/methylene tetrahydromethanopterin reductase-like flavin-dependent oxidoreductase (luciferase family)